MSSRKRAARLWIASIGCVVAVAGALPAWSARTQVVERYYQNILGRAADAGGLAFWLGESDRMIAEGVDPAEALRVLALGFYGSAEFTSRSLADSAFIDNLYVTFFDRAADAAGRNYWLSQLSAGLTRDMVVNSFLFSSEFGAYMAREAGSVASRGEVYPVIDFYRGAFGRLPDSDGARYWLGQFRSAQCQAASARAAAVRQAANDIAAAFLASPEYGARARSDTQYVGDLYNAFLRRGADATGFAFWVGALRTQTRAQVLQFFLASAEFSERVNAVASAGCVRLAAPAVTNVAATAAYNSSSKLAVSWTAPSEITASLYKVSAVDAVGGESSSAMAAGTSAQLTGLKSATSYSVTVAPCVTFSTATVCYESPASATTSATPSEVWQLQGSGNTVAGLTPIVSDGNVRISATRFGSDAPSSMAGRMQLYYGPRLSTQALTVGIASAAANAATPSTYLSFTSLATSSGLNSPPTAATLVKQIATGQGVPLSSAMGGKVRLFFEAMGNDGKTRIFHVDSADGYVGRDFHAGSPTQCGGSAADYEAGGGCTPTVAIGVQGDAVQPSDKILNARQNKVAWPALDDWRWNGAAGTFMVFTTDRVTGCTTLDRNHGYAAWDGSRWVVQYDSAGCPKLFKGVQAMLPMHIGGARYKMYYGDTTDITGRLNTSMPFLGPKKLIYANGAKTGAAGTVDFEDWEAVTAGRDVVFVWPDGTQLNATAEGYIDDFHFHAPTGTLDLQVAYIAITEGTVAPIAVAAVLLNP